ncbi:hypothetical protein KQ940_22450 [Marinobacterium sp. D7]|uniref:hypothetical protein n=1 Tax=Marinobacterium ramblicola TaxID=2849041 RepID=UPI001C2D3DBF|nr:hypothetical protein [Marinobacterium ramblicola]MBV1790832.1 hypothetical protein [Marinobacterium ramblicola]
MSKKMEDILGLGPIDKERKVPGTSVVEGREYRYVSCGCDNDIAALFKKLIRKVDPPLATSGGAVNDGCKVTLPSGECYFAVSYKGDIDGWRQQIEQGAAALGLSVAKISQSGFLLDDGNEIPLSECEFQFS